MKNLIFIICITILLRPTLPVFDYIVNYDYITTELCVNKEAPIKGCNGKCYLMKNLAEASENEKPTSSDKKHSTEISDFYFAAFTPIDDAAFHRTEFVAVNSVYSNLYGKMLTISFFHPPTHIS